MEKYYVTPGASGPVMVERSPWYLTAAERRAARPRWRVERTQDAELASSRLSGGLGC